MICTYPEVVWIPFWKLNPVVLATDILVSLIPSAVDIVVGTEFGLIPDNVRTLLSACIPWPYWVTSITLPEYKSFISVELVIVVAAIATALLPLYTTKLLLAVNSWPCTFVR